MNVKRFLLVIGLALMCSSWVYASTVVPGHFVVDLNDVTGVDGGGWGANTLFTDTVNTVTSTNGFNQSVCLDPDTGEAVEDCDGGDPRMGVNSGGASVPFPTSFNADGKGGGVFDFQNDGNKPITDILFVAPFNPNNSYSCDSNIFAFCGFKIVNQGGNQKLDILFVNGSIANVPEPSEFLFLLGACAAVAVAHRLRSQRAA
jgi:hypothetical protein